MKMKKILALVLCLLTLFQLTGCSFNVRVLNGKDKEFTYENMHITLTEDFTEQELPNVATGYVSPLSAVLVTYVPNETGLKEYTGFLYENLNALEQVEMMVDAPEFTDRGGYFRYTGTEDDGRVSVYSSYTYETPNGLWCIQFVCSENAFDHMEPKFDKWEATIRFDEV